MHPQPSAPWLEYDETTSSLFGNRAGLDLLHGAIGRVLVGTDSVVTLDGDRMFLREIKLMESEAPAEPAFNSESLSCLFLLLILICVLGLACFGLFQLVSLNF